MKKFTSIIAVLLLTTLVSVAADNDPVKPSGTFRFAQKDSTELFLDYYAPAKADGAKPAILFAFGGGFVRGSRVDKEYLPYYQSLAEAGHPVIAIDYRLGMKGRKFTGKNIKTFNLMYDAVTMAVEDLFSATSWLLENGPSIGVDARNMVICGSSAGAITVLQAAWALDRRNASRESRKDSAFTAAADACGIPEGFQYKAVMSFSGAVVFKDGAPHFSEKMCPALLFHGTSDEIVKYTKFQLFSLGMAGSCSLDGKMTRDGVNHSFYRYEGKGHEIANMMNRTLDKQEEFLRRVVIGGEKFSTDATISDPAVKPFRLSNLKDLY